MFARPEHPLALFVDDLQWLDSATLDLLEELLTQSDVRNLLVIGAYRDNEVGSAHPLVRKLHAIREAGAVVHEIALAPLAREDLTQLVADALHAEPQRVATLARLVGDKTAGNPFFTIQFLTGLDDEGLLSFDHAHARWSWDLDGIRAKRYTDNVADLMFGKLARLPAATQQALQSLACLGNSAEVTTLALVLGTSAEQVHAELWEAVRFELVELVGALIGSFTTVCRRPPMDSFQKASGPTNICASGACSRRIHHRRSARRRSSRSSISSIAVPR